VDPVPDPLLLRKSGSAGDRTRDLCICSQKLWPLDHRGGQVPQDTTQKQTDGMRCEVVWWMCAGRRCGLRELHHQGRSFSRDCNARRSYLVVGVSRTSVNIDQLLGVHIMNLAIFKVNTSSFARLRRLYKILSRKKLWAEWSQGILAIVRCKFCLPVCYPKI